MADAMPEPLILCVNAGSATLKCALYRERGPEPELVSRTERDAGPDELADALADVLADLPRPPDAIAHRIVHGGPHLVDHCIIDDGVLEQLRQALPFAPLHLPAEIAAVDAAARLGTDLVQVACFDTAFHQTLPEVAHRLPLPERFANAGVRRFGFHGLSCEYVVSAIGTASLGHAVVAHLGSGASVTAIAGGRSVDTSMGLTPAGGVVMATRTGDLDPGVLVHLAREHRLDVDAIERLVNRESGLLALSGTTNDMRTLLERRAADADDRRPALAIAAFCTSVAKQIASMSAVLDAVRTIVFTGGIGEHAPAVRSEICARLGPLGVEVDVERNARGDAVISADRSAIDVRVVATDENLVMARHAARLRPR